jgi:hypothetical protein
LPVVAVAPVAKAAVVTLQVLAAAQQTLDQTRQEALAVAQAA